MADAADQAKLDCPLIRQGGRRATSVKKIRQQFIGVIVHHVGYLIYRRLPVRTSTLLLVIPVRTSTLLLVIYRYVQVYHE